jgi:hypothetical protein
MDADEGSGNVSGFWKFGRLSFFAVFFEFTVSFSVELRLFPRPALGVEVAGQKLGVAWLAPMAGHTSAQGGGR